MRELSYTLVTDGPADAVLVPILDRLLREQAPRIAFSHYHADSRLRMEKPLGLENRLSYALFAYPCDLLFIHRDAEREPPEHRRKEIEAAVSRLKSGRREGVPPTVCVIPVRMTEAWLLFDEKAIRRASDNPNGKVALDLPRVVDLEEVPGPKELLRDRLARASELAGRRRKAFRKREREAVHRVAAVLDDFAPLRSLSAFRALEEEIQSTLNRAGFID